MKQTTSEFRVHDLDAARQWADDRELILVVVSAETKTVRLESGDEGFPKYTNSEHVMSEAEVPSCIYCGCDDDDAYVGNEPCVEVLLPDAICEFIAEKATPTEIVSGIKNIE